MGKLVEEYPLPRHERMPHNIGLTQRRTSVCVTPNHDFYEFPFDKHENKSPQIDISLPILMAMISVRNKCKHEVFLGENIQN